MSGRTAPPSPGRHGTIALLHPSHEGALPTGVDGNACRRTPNRVPLTPPGDRVTP